MAIVSMLTHPCIEHTIFHASYVMNSIVSCGAAEDATTDAKDDDVTKPKQLEVSPGLPELAPVSFDVEEYVPQRSMPEGSLNVSWVCKNHHGSTVEHWQGTLLLTTRERGNSQVRRLGWIDSYLVARVDDTAIKVLSRTCREASRVATNFFNAETGELHGHLQRGRAIANPTVLFLQNILIVPEYRGLGLALYLVDQASEINQTGTVVLDASVTDCVQEMQLTKSSSLSKLRGRSFHRTPSIDQVREQIQRERSLNASTAVADESALDYYRLLNFAQLNGSLYMTRLHTEGKVDIHDVCPHLF